MTELAAVFVYGTLRPGEVNWHQLEPYATASEPARLPGHRLYELEYPCAVGVHAADDASAVIGDLVWLDAAALDAAIAHLDWFEDYRADDPDGSLYLREPTAVLTVAGVNVPCWVYVAGLPQRDRLRAEHEVTGGEWRSNGGAEPRR